MLSGKFPRRLSLGGLGWDASPVVHTQLRGHEETGGSLEGWGEPSSTIQSKPGGNQQGLHLFKTDAQTFLLLTEGWRRQQMKL